MASSLRPARRVFTSLPERHRFFDQVWNIVRTIPCGRVCTYGQIATVIERPAGVTVRHFKAARARWVGQAMAQCPSDVPWHRVVNAQGKISHRRTGDSHRTQHALLVNEGVIFEKGDRIRLEHYGWSPQPDQNT